MWQYFYIIKDRMRRFSVVFDDSYKAYKTIFKMPIEIEEESQLLISCIEDGDWRSYASAIHKINTTVKEIRRIAILNSFIIDREILNEITSDQSKFESFEQNEIPPQGASMHENRKEISIKLIYNDEYYSLIHLKIALKYHDLRCFLHLGLIHPEGIPNIPECEEEPLSFRISQPPKY